MLLRLDRFEDPWQIFAQEDDDYPALTPNIHHSGADLSARGCINVSTFPCPWPPGHEPQDDPHVQPIGNAARELVQLRETQSGARTLT